LPRFATIARRRAFGRIHESREKGWPALHWSNVRVCPPGSPQIVRATFAKLESGRIKSPALKADGLRRATKTITAALLRTALRVSVKKILAFGATQLYLVKQNGEIP
jgi:hypothetical protein